MALPLATEGSLSYKPAMTHLASLHLAFSFLTRLPLPPQGALPDGALARAMRMFPLVGAAVGLAGGLVYLLAVQALAPMVAALLALATTALITGALHEDGLADTADGLGGGRDREAKLAIMRDSRIGGYGALALVLSVGLRAATLADISAGWPVLAAMVAAGAVSRALLPAVMLASRPARADGLGHGAGLPRSADVAVALGLALLVLLLLLMLDGSALVWAVLLAALSATAMAALSSRQIGGYTGDILGAVQQVSEIAVLLAVAANG